MKQDFVIKCNLFYKKKNLQKNKKVRDCRR
jgi:hypothetical protein